PPRSCVGADAPVRERRRVGNFGGRVSYYSHGPPARSGAFAVTTRARTSADEAQARLAAEVCLDSKANDVVLLDLHGVTDMTDYFVIASGTSDTHVRSIAEHVIERLGAMGVRVRATDGLAHGRWVVLDFVDFVVHVFHPSLRSYYQLERLWGDAPTLALHR